MTCWRELQKSACAVLCCTTPAWYFHTELKLNLRRSTSKEFAHLDARRQNVDGPDATRLLLKGNKSAAREKKTTSLEQWPMEQHGSMSGLTEPCVVNRSERLSWQFFRSLRYCGRKPPDPAEEPAGNDMILSDGQPSSCHLLTSLQLLLSLFYCFNFFLFSLLLNEG